MVRLGFRYVFGKVEGMFEIVLKGFMDTPQLPRSVQTHGFLLNPPLFYHSLSFMSNTFLSDERREGMRAPALNA